jgi:hypothetical protein
VVWDWGGGEGRGLGGRATSAAIFAIDLGIWGSETVAVSWPVSFSLAACDGWVVVVVGKVSIVTCLQACGESGVPGWLPRGQQTAVTSR